METEKLNYISILRIIATIAVVAIHASSGYLNGDNIVGFDWQYANWINSFTRFSVPIFVILSGALLLPKQEDAGSFYSKRLSKLIYPFIFWTLVYTFYNTAIFHQPVGQIFSTLLDEFTHGANAHLWYLYMIIGLYFAIPFIQKIIQNSTIRELEIFLVIWFISLFLFNKRWQSDLPRIDITFFSSYTGYLVLGYYLRIKDFSQYKWFSLAICLLTACITALLTLRMSIDKHSFDSLLYGYLSPNTAIIAASLFIFIKSIASNIKLPHWAQVIDQYSFGIYLSHILFLNYIHPILPVDTWLKIPLATLLTVLLASLFTYILRKIPFGKYVSG